jgi:hypothetical protein
VQEEWDTADAALESAAAALIDMIETLQAAQDKADHYKDIRRDSAAAIKALRQVLVGLKVAVPTPTPPSPQV